MTRAATVGYVVAISCVMALGGCAQYDAYGRPTKSGVLNQDVQRLWDNTFDVNRDGDRATWERQREIDRRNWCATHPDYARCGPYR